MTTVYLIRHGENDFVKKGRLAGRLEGVHLNQKGINQALSVAKFLKKHPIKAIYSSPLERTMETAQPIADELNLKVEPKPGLVEVDYGLWQNKRLKELSKLKVWEIVQYIPSRMKFPSGESFLDAQYRISSELDNLATLYDQKDIIVCVSHSDIIKLAIAFYIGMPIDVFQRLVISPASITALDIGYRASFLKFLNFDISFTLSEE